MKCYKITTSSQHSKVSYEAILEAQVVIVSSQFVQGMHYGNVSRNDNEMWFNYINPTLPTFEDSLERKEKTKYKKFISKDHSFVNTSWKSDQLYIFASIC